MTLNHELTRKTLNASLLAVLILSLFFNPLPVSATGSGPVLPTFEEFSQSVQNGAESVLRGVYVPDALALPVVQQPSNNAAYVSNHDGEVTQFAMASRFGNVGLLAHNHLSGKSFSQLTIGQEVRLVYGNGKVETFIVTEVLQYQALQPNSPYSEFRSLEGGRTLTAEQMFKRVYFGDRHVTFQTCIEKDGDLSWGRLFVIAVPREEYKKPGLFQ
ncbi:MAG: hypothetical protein HXY35_04300 [Chloroflexi bacterium]|nr:hypothetical protein [Chloroflexota bacterium]